MTAKEQIDAIVRELQNLMVDEQRHKTRKAQAEADHAEMMLDAMRRELRRKGLGG